MTVISLPRFRLLLQRYNTIGDLKDEAQRHEMSATLNRSALTQQDEGTNAFTTSQLCWLVTSNPNWTYDHPFVQVLVLSAMIDDEIDIVREAQLCGIIPASWTWMTWADGFAGNQNQLLFQLHTIGEMNQRCAAACFATRTCPQAIGKQLLMDMCHANLASVYHSLLRRALTGPHAARIAAEQLESLRLFPEVLFSADTDATIALLVNASDLSHPEKAILPYTEATADLTRTAIARRHLERGRSAEALNLIKDLRFLSIAYDQAIVVAALAALESGDFTQANAYAPSIPDRLVRLKVQTRIAQATGDLNGELESLVALAQLCPQDGQVFVQLVNLLDRTRNFALARQVCFQAQERFSNDPLVAALIQRHAGAAG